MQTENVLLKMTMRDSWLDSKRHEVEKEAYYRKIWQIIERQKIAFENAQNQIDEAWENS